jgi:hypothetical protein
VRQQGWHVATPDEVRSFLSSCEEGLRRHIFNCYTEDVSETRERQFSEIKNFNSAIDRLVEGKRRLSLLNYAVDHDGQMIAHHRVRKKGPWRAYFRLDAARRYAKLKHISYVRTDREELENNSATLFAAFRRASCGRDLRTVEEALAADEELFLKDLEDWLKSRNG